MSWRRVAVLAVFLLSVATTASAQTVRVIVERALVWTQPSGVSIVMTQLTRGQTAEVVRRVGDWYEIVAPPGSGGGDQRTGFIAVSQVELVAGDRGRSQPPARRTPARAVPRPRFSRVVNIDGGYRAGVEDVTRAANAFTQDFAEQGTIATNFGKRSGFAFNFLVAQPVEGTTGIGLAVDYYVRSQKASVDAHVPHPFYFNQLRTATFAAPALSAHEAALHIPFLWMPPARGRSRLRILAFGGPSLFYLSQTVVSDVNLDEEYPYDTVSITGVVTEDRKSIRFGFHAGADFSYMRKPGWGFGAGVRYSRATLKFRNDGDADTTGAAGGVTAVGGLRFRF
jgi:hypothetical protein